MDEESILRDFERLEERLNGLVSTCEALSAENSQLSARVRELTEKLSAFEQTENRMREERSAVRQKIEGLLARLGEQSRS
ncbi:MAG: cell division protein ZapB [Thermodesulfobacteriota bacterium]